MVTEFPISRWLTVSHGRCLICRAYAAEHAASSGMAILLQKEVTIHSCDLLPSGHRFLANGKEVISC